MARCGCLKDCNCFILDDGYDGFFVSNNDTTFVSGIGTPSEPYVISNTQDPQFVPPLAKVSYAGAAGATPSQITFQTANFNTAGMFNTNQPDRINVVHSGLYLVGFNVGFETQFNNSVTSFDYGAYVTYHRFGDSLSFPVAKYQAFESTNHFPLTKYASQARVMPIASLPGDFFTMHIEYDVKPLGITASMWVSYI